MLFAVIVLGVMLLLNAVFAMSELAVMTSRQSRLQHAAMRGNRGASVALGLAKEPTRFLSTVQVGITLIGILSGAIGERALSGRLEPTIASVEILERHSSTISLVLVSLVITYFTLVFGELVPKRLALAHPEAVASRIARPLTVLSTVAAAPIRLLSASTDLVLGVLRVRSRPGDDISEEDVKALVARAATTGVFDPTEHRIFQRMFRLGDIRVGSLMIHRGDIVWIDEDATPERVRLIVGTNPYSHFPVCKGHIDGLVGVIHIKDLIAHGLLAGARFKPADIAHKPLFVPEATPVTRVLDLFQRARTHVAFVVNEFGGVEGLITLNDIVGAIVGDLSRAGEEEAPSVHRRQDGSYLMDGRVGVHEVLAALSLPGGVEDRLTGVNTAAGLVVALLGRLPTTGESVEWEGWRFEVVDMDGKRVDKILASPVNLPSGT
ncbi:MAG: HlyC/CorC family transporter [Phycisphaeraceae bacterium]|nr:MAG: HlyC/CorC family transporter [Phycisphaeraceae bacterium]